MDIITTSSLNSSQKEEIQFLMDACRKKDPITLSFPFEEAGLYTLMGNRGHICSAAAFIKEEETVWECAAFTHPDFRNRGFFSALLEKGLDILPPETELLFYSDGKSQDTLQTLSAMEAEPIGEEYMMELSLDRKRFPILSGTDAREGELCERELHDAEPCEEALHGAKLQTPEPQTLLFSSSFGSVKISVFESHYYLYDFEIQKPFRKMGHGKRLLLAVLGALSAQRELPITLQVSGHNRAAISLYEKTGFRITETLSCFLY